MGSGTTNEEDFVDGVADLAREAVEGSGLGLRDGIGGGCFS